MSDDRLREAERVFRETGSVADEARYLNERVRAGLLARERLELAAELRDEAAVLALGGPGGPRAHTVREVFAGIERFGVEVAARAGVIVARRCGALRPEMRDTEACLAAIEAWLDCPCDRHRVAMQGPPMATTHMDARLAVGAALGRDRFGGGHPLPAFRSPETRDDSHEPDAVLVAAVRRALARWALAPHEPRASDRPAKGSLLDVRIGDARQAGTFRLLIDRDRTTLGDGGECGIQLERAPVGLHAIVRAGGGFELHEHLASPFAFLNDERVRDGPLATGDVISFGDTWLEVSVLGADLPEDVARAREEADRLVRGGGGKRPIEVAATLGHLGATLAASRLRIPLSPRFDDGSRIRALPRVGPEAAATVKLRVAREVRSVWEELRPEDDSFARALEVTAAWLREPSEETRAAATALRQRLNAVMKEHSSRPVHGLARLAWSCLGGVVAGEDHVGDATAATAAGMSLDRVWTLVREELLAWALGPERPSSPAGKL
ncbi:MAG TPA: FHA domain-containing protein [Planctomycetota bacterium]|nr:FHA domain-containing protein [Planctomycetota bacterium]